MLVFTLPAVAQEAAMLKAEPETLTLSIGEETDLKVTAMDAAGNPVEATILMFSRARRSVGVDRETGRVKAYRPGSFTITAMVQGATDGTEALMVDVPVDVRFPPIEQVSIPDLSETLYAGTQLLLHPHVMDASGASRDNVTVTYASSDPSVLGVNAMGGLMAHKTGTAMLTVEAEGVQMTQSVEIVANPIRSLDLSVEADGARTGDVLVFNATAMDANANPVPDAPIQFALSGFPDTSWDPSATLSGQILPDGRFVAESPGTFTITATTPGAMAQQTIQVAPRDVATEIELVGQGVVGNVHTSDLWVWEGVDGRDYAITGTWGGDGEAYFWDVTDPADILPIDTVKVDARTVNDVKVNEAGDVCIIGREGASNRKNGIVILDCSNPYEVTTITEYTENLTGGVHNLFIYENHVYALSGGQRYHIINIEDPAQPRQVGTFEVDSPRPSIHDVWVVDGIAYSSNWSDGVVMVDVGNGIAGGSPSNPVEIGRYAYPSGWNHAAFPYHDKQTGKFYIIGGDEKFPDGLDRNGANRAAGWLHFIDFTDPTNPKEVARYEVPEAGTHNFWVEDDTLYVAYYNGGLRVVDLSGDLMGDLYKQGREMAKYFPVDPNGYVPNAPFTWGPQPHKGHIFFSDWNSGLWSTKLKKPETPKPEG
ncbi:MAG: Ig-like domain-containing protein [Rhodothermales bacterium]